MSKLTAEQASRRETALKNLRAMLPPGSTITTAVCDAKQGRSWSSYHLFVPAREMNHATGKKVWVVASIAWEVAVVLGLERCDRGGVKSSGYGLSRSFELVYSLGRVLYPDGFVPAKHGMRGRNGIDPKVRDTDGGYAFHEQRT